MSDPNHLPSAIDLSSVFGKARQRVNRVGVELEGLWSALPKGVRVIRDGSVSFRADQVVPGVQIGELPSRVMEVSEMAPWVLEYYPSAVNSSCGMHLHVSFKRAGTYQRMMDPRLILTTVEYVRQWAVRAGLPATHPLFHRLTGASEYCQLAFNADQQARATSKGYNHHAPGHRYTVWNYAFSRYGTIECRLLPMMANAELAVSALEEIIKIVNAFLVVTAREPSGAQECYQVDSESIEEDFNEIV